MKKILLIIFFTGSYFIAFSQFRDWINYNTRVSKYPENIYFSGFTSQYIKKTDDLNAVKDNLILSAKSTLSESIKVNIESNITNKITNINTITTEDFKKISRSYSSIEIAGIQTEFYLKKKKKEAYAFAFVKKSKVKKYYRDQIAITLDLIQSKVSQADKYIESEDKVKALPLLQDARVLVRKLEGAQTILIICGESDEGILSYKKGLELNALIVQNINWIHSTSRNFNLNELAYYLSSQLYLKEKKIEKIQIENIFYQDTDMSSQLSAKLTTLLKSNISKESISIEYSDYEKDGYKLKGSYWEDSSELQIIVNLFKKEGSEKSLINSVEGWIKIDLLKQGKINFIPKNYKDASNKNKVFNQNAIVNGGASLEIWTNKGTKGPVFREGDLLKIFVNTSQPGYLRLLNFWADSTQLLLEDNYYISPQNTNQALLIPIEWETSCPCGVEYLQAIIQSQPFDKLKTVEKDGFVYLLDSFKKVIESSHKFKKELADGNNFMAEKKIMLTTLLR